MGREQARRRGLGRQIGIEAENDIRLGVLALEQQPAQQRRAVFDARHTRVLQAQIASKAFCTAGPGPHSEVKEL